MCGVLWYKTLHMHTYCTHIEHTLHTSCTHLSHTLHTSCTWLLVSSIFMQWLLVSSIFMSMATSFFYIYVTVTSFFYIYIDIYITFINWRSVQSFYWTPFFVMWLLKLLLSTSASVIWTVLPGRLPRTGRNCSLSRRRKYGCRNKWARRWEFNQIWGKNLKKLKLDETSAQQWYY